MRFDVCIATIASTLTRDEEAEEALTNAYEKVRLAVTTTRMMKSRVKIGTMVASPRIELGTNP